MGADPGDFRFQQGNPEVELGLRKWVERFGGQPAGKVARGARSLYKIHCSAQWDASSLAVNRPRG